MLIGIIKHMGDDFVALVNDPAKAIIDCCVRFGLII
jgi:hypothetical protein